MAVGFDSSSSINSSNEKLGCKSLLLSHIRLIGEEAPRFFHIVCEEEPSRDPARPIRNPQLRYHHASIKADQALLIIVVINF